MIWHTPKCVFIQARPFLSRVTSRIIIAFCVNIMFYSLLCTCNRIIIHAVCQRAMMTSGPSYTLRLHTSDLGIYSKKNFDEKEVGLLPLNSDFYIFFFVIMSIFSIKSHKYLRMETIILCYWGWWWLVWVFNGKDFSNYIFIINK